MKKSIVLILISLSFWACTNKKVDAQSIQKLNGYWEIVKVELPNGSDKNYKINPTIDYFELQNNKGFRQKVMPQLNGKYLTNGNKENISISNKNETYYLNYSTNYSQWKEEIIQIEDSVLVLKNSDNLEYHYKRHVPFSLK